MDDARWFLNTVFEDALAPECVLSIFALPSKSTFFAASIAAAANHVEQIQESQNVYCGVGLYRAGIAGGRGTAADVLALPALAADIDFGVSEKKPKAPPDESSARRLISKIGLQPSFIVHSGHGFQPWWLLAEPIEVGDGAAALFKRWGATLTACAAALGWTIDSTFDLARVLRVPGTVNRKVVDAPLPVRLIVEDDIGRRYQRSDIESWCIDDRPAASGDDVPVDPVAIGKDRAPPSLKLDALMENDKRFRQSWQMKRKDLPDQSASSYDMSLATIAASAGWSDQEIADLIVGFRTKHNLKPEKAHRRDYLQATISRARKTNAPASAAARITAIEASAPPSEPIDAPAPPAADGEMLTEINRAFGLPSRIVRVIRGGEEDPFYAIELDDGTDISLGDTTALMNQTAVRTRIAATLRHVVPKMKQKVFDTLIQAMLHVAEQRDDAGMTRAERCAEWLCLYLDGTKPAEGAEVESAFKAGRPWLYRGEWLHISSERLHAFVAKQFPDRVTRKNVVDALRVSGFVMVTRKSPCSSEEEPPVRRWHTIEQDRLRSLIGTFFYSARRKGSATGATALPH